jgi:hypothetical protein
MEGICQIQGSGALNNRTNENTKRQTFQKIPENSEDRPVRQRTNEGD